MAVIVVVIVVMIIIYYIIYEGDYELQTIYVHAIRVMIFFSPPYGS